MPARKDSQASRYKSTIGNNATVDGIEDISPEDREFFHRDSHDLEAFQNTVTKAFTLSQVFLIAPLLIASIYIFTTAKVPQADFDQVTGFYGQMKMDELYKCHQRLGKMR